MHLTLTPEDIVAARKGQQSIKKVLKNIRNIFIGIVVLGGWAAATIYLLESYLPRPSILENTFQISDLLLFPVIIVLTIYGTVLIHEFGHLIAGLLNRFEFNYLVVGPVKVSKGRRGLRLDFSGLRLFQIGGLASLRTADEKNLKQRYFWMIAGGPLANVLQGVFFIIVVVLLKDQTITFLLDKFLYTSIIWPFVLFLPSSLIPITTGGFTNDGTRMWFLWKETQRAYWHMQWVLLTTILHRGCSPGQLDTKQLQTLRDTAETEMEKYVASCFLYDFHMDNGDFLHASTALNDGLLAVQSDSSLIYTPLAFLEAAYFVAQVIKDEKLARDWLDLAQEEYKRKNVFVPLVSLLRAEAAVLKIEGQFEKAYEKAAEALNEIESDTSQPNHKLELSYLEKITSECIVELGTAPTVRVVNRNQHVIWSISKSFLKITFLIGSIVLCTLCLILLSITDIPYDLRGFYYEMRGDDARALQVYEEGMASLDEPNSRLLNNHGEILMRQGKLSEALADFNASILADPDRYEAYMNRGFLYLEVELYGMAILDLDKSLELEPIENDILDIYFARAASLSGISEFDLAAQDYDQILRLSGDPDVIELATRYRNLVLGVSNE